MQGTDSRALADRKRLGIYYTPSNVAEALVQWALRLPTDTVLEPSFGGCNFLRASHARLLALGSDDPLRQICGTDIDKHALDALGAAFGIIDVQRRFLLKDFLATAPGELCIEQFDAVVGNPPYVSHHLMSQGQKEAAWDLARHHGWPVRRTASLWAYFLLHSFSFCKRGGRMAFVLPPQFLSADYAGPVRDHIERSFDEVTLEEVPHRIFTEQGTNERSILLFAEGYHARPSNVRVSLTSAMDRKHSLAFGAASATTFDALLSESEPLGAFVDIRIGTVTGANKLFVVTPQTAEVAQLPDDVLVAALARIPKLHGLEYTHEDHVETVTAGGRCYLVRPPSNPLEEQTREIRRYFGAYSPDEIAKNRTFKKRRRWFVVEDINEPDAFLSYMHHEGPVMLLNTTRAVCMNNIHRLWWKNDISIRDQKLIAISFLSTFTRLSAELEGRTYGGGVLKHELQEARRIRVLRPSSLSNSAVDGAYRRIDELLRAGKRRAAGVAADKLLVSAFPAVKDKSPIAPLAAALDRLRRSRTPRT
jgi:hypothetical protein